VRAAARALLDAAATLRSPVSAYVDLDPINML